MKNLYHFACIPLTNDFFCKYAYFKQYAATFFFSFLLYIDRPIKRIRHRILLVNTRSSRVLKHLTGVYYTNLQFS